MNGWPSVQRCFAGKKSALTIGPQRWYICFGFVNRSSITRGADLSTVTLSALLAVFLSASAHPHPQEVKTQGSVAGDLSASGDSLQALLETAVIAGNASKWNRAVELLERASEIAPERVDVLRALFLAEVHAGLLQDTRLTVRKMVERAGLNDEPVLQFVLSALIQAGQWEEAEPYALRIHEAHPDNGRASLELGIVAYNLNNLEEANKQIVAALRTNSHDSGALFYLGLIQRAEGDSDAAIKSLRDSLLGNSRNSQAFSELGTLYLEKGDLPNACKALETAVGIAPGEPWLRYQLSLVYSRMGLRGKSAEEIALYRKYKSQDGLGSGTTRSASK